MPTVGTSSKPAYVYDAGTDTWIPIGPGEHTHAYIPNTLTTTTGDIIYASGANTPARLGIGSSGQVLGISAGVPAWTTPSSGGMTLISETTASGLSSLALSGIAGTYKELYLVWEGIVHSTTGTFFDLRFNNDSAGNYAFGLFGIATNNSGIAVIDSDQSSGATSITGTGSRYTAFGGDDATGGTLDKNTMGWLRIDNYASTTKLKHFYGNFWNYDNSGGNIGRNACVINGVYNSTSAITSINVVRTSGSATFSNATNTTIRLYGVS